MTKLQNYLHLELGVKGCFNASITNKIILGQFYEILCYKTNLISNLNYHQINAQEEALTLKV